MFISLKLTGLTCEACTKLSQKRLAKIPGVNEVTPLSEKGSFSINVSQKITKDEVAAALAGTSYSIVSLF